MRIAELAVERYQFTIVTFLLLVALGVHAMLEIPRAEDPSFPTTGYLVVAVYPGASPTEIERLVVDPIEEAIAELHDLEEMKTQIEDGVAVIYCHFVETVDPDAKYDEVLRQVNQARAELPSTLATLEVRRVNTNDAAILQLALVAPSAPYKELEAIAERLRTRLGAIAGVRDSEIWAHAEQQLRVELDAAKLAQLRISVAQVAAALEGASISVPGGRVDAGRRSFNVQTSGAFSSAEEVAATVVGAADGALVRLGDVADVRWDYEEQEHVGRFNGERAVFVTVTQREHANIFAIRDRVFDELRRFEATLPAGVRLERGFDQSVNVERRLDGLLRDFGLAILLVLVTLLPLGLRASLIVMISIPLSLAMGVALLYFTGHSINQLSIVGFVIALGLLVDDSIVVTENVTRFLREGYSRRQAAIEATKQIGVAVVGCTATLLLAFLPLLALPGTAGQFIRSMPLAVVFTIAASLVVSVSIIPFLASLLLREESGEGNRVYRWFHEAIERSYRPALHWALARPRTTLALSAVLFAGSLALVPLIGFSLFPKAGTPQFRVTVETPEGSSLEETDRAVRVVEDALRSAPEVVSFMSNVGHGNPQVYYNVQSRSTKSNFGEILVQLHEYDARRTPAFLDALRAELGDYPSANIEVKEFENGPAADAPIAIRLLGDDLDALRTAAEGVERVLLETEGTQYVNNPVRLAKTDLALRVDRELAGRLGVPEAEIERGVRMAIAGVTAGTLRDASGEERAIVLTLPREGRQTLRSLEHLHVAAVTGAQVPLSQVARLALSSSPTIIRHHDRERAVTVTAHVRTGYNTDRVTKAALTKLADTTLPEGVRLTAGGEIESRQKSFGGLGAAILVAIFGVLAVLVLEFKTFKSTLIVASVVPLGIIGGLGALFLSGYSLSFTATVGFVALVGIEVKNSILLVDFTNQLRGEGIGVDEAIERAGAVRFFPILLTTLTALGGLAPLALEGSALYSPLALVIMGGLVSSTVLARLVTPVMYKLLAPQVAAT